MQVTGAGTTTVTGTVWAAGTAEPAAAQLTHTDTTAALRTPPVRSAEELPPDQATSAQVGWVTFLTVTAAGRQVRPGRSTVARTRPAVPGRGTPTRVHRLDHRFRGWAALAPPVSVVPSPTVTDIEG